MKSTKNSLKVLGVMTGTSCDGLDAACIEIDPQSWSPLWNASAAYPAKLRKRVLDAQKAGAKLTSQSWVELNRDLGLFYSQTIASILKSAPEKPDLIANHGQTVAHFPSTANAKAMGGTWQLGDASRIAEATGLTVTCQFRDGDMAAGGQGAPLVPMFHRMIALPLGGERAGVAIHNLGGISNLTYVGPRDTTLAFDTGPGNLWIDLAAQLVTKGKQSFDRSGALARAGEPDAATVAKVLKHPYFNLKPPKSTGRDDFTAEFFLSVTKDRSRNLVATATSITAESIARAYEKWILAAKLPLREVFFCGGGAKNGFLLESIQARLPQVRIRTIAEAGLDDQYIEAQAFAFLGFMSLLGQPLGGSWTGAQGFAPPGHIIPGENWSTVLNCVRGFI